MARRSHPLCAIIFAACCFINVSAAAEVGEDGRWHLGSPVKGGEQVKIPAGNNITAAYFSADPARAPIVVGFNQDATEVTLDVPPGDGGEVVLEVAEKTTQFPDGRIVLAAPDAVVGGEKAKLESHPGNHRIGFWSEIADTVRWKYKATRPGMYEVELCYSLAGGANNRVQVAFAEEKVAGELAPTGSWYRYSVVPLGRVYIARPGPLQVEVRGLEIKGGALMNLKALTLRPAPEGKPVAQAEDGSIELDSHDATVHGKLLQYERKETKLCLGYWTNPREWAEWTIPVREAGRFRVELTQGCGAGHGGSEVAVHVGGEVLEFTVDDTGGFQNWKVRQLGEVSFDKPGDHRLEIRPKNKKRGAVMDVRRVRLIPVE